MSGKKYQKLVKGGLAIALAAAMIVGMAVEAGTGIIGTAATAVRTDQKVAADAASIFFTTRVLTDNIKLPISGKNGATITWSSSNPDVIKTDGTVNRPKSGEPDAAVTLEGTIKMNNYSKTRKFDFVVLAEAELGESKQFAMNEVEVVDDYYLAAQTSDIKFLNDFDTDRLLSRFRETAGLDTKGKKPYGGWESSLLGGHCVGHYLTAAAQGVKATGDAELKKKLETLMDGMEECQNALGTGFLFGAEIRDKANVEKQFDLLEEKGYNTDIWVPWYNMHKLVQGFVDVYKFTGNEKALKIGSKLGDWVYNRVSKWNAATQGRVLSVEYGGMNDCMYELYAITKNKNHLEAAHKFDETNLFTTVAKGAKNCLDGKHANTAIPKFVGALKRYIVLKDLGELADGDEKYLTWAEKFFAIAVERHSYVTGGVSIMEHFRKENQQDSQRTQTNCESCCAHNMLKMARELFKITGDKKYADYYETTLRNSIMAAIRSESGQAAYFIPMATGYFKTFGEADPAKNMFWCCTGSGMENFTKLSDSIYFHTDDKLIVNQYFSSKVNWEEKNAVITQSADVTKSEEATFTIKAAEGKTMKTFALALRVPDWMHGTATVTVNGTKENTAASGGYIVLNREWNDGDTVKIQYPMEVDAFGLPDNSSVYAFRYGPTVLAAKLGAKRMKNTTWAGANLTAPEYKVVGDQEEKKGIQYGEAKAGTPLSNETLMVQGDLAPIEYIDQINEYMVRDEGEELSFHIKGTNAETTFENGGLQFVPFNTLNDERYGIYWYFDRLDAEKTEDEILEEKENGRVDANIVDSTQPGYEQYENDVIHQLTQKDSEAGTMEGGGSTRCAKAGGYFAYNMVVNKEKTNSLICQFAKEDTGKTIKISVGDAVIAEKTLDYSGEDAFYKEYFAIPDDVTKANVTTLKPEGDDKEYTVVKVRFESNSATEASARLVGGLSMVQGYSNDATLKTIKFFNGEVQSEGNVTTCMLKNGTKSVEVQYELNSRYGYVYVDDKLIDDSKPQTYEMKGREVTLNIKVYAEDHETTKDYVVKLIELDPTPEPTMEPTAVPTATPAPTPDNTNVTPTTPPVKKASISISGKKTVKKGKSIALTVKKKNIKGTAKWSVDKKKIAKLSKKSGDKVKLKGLKKGKVKVTVKVGKLKKSITVKVK